MVEILRTRDRIGISCIDYRLSGRIRSTYSDLGQRVCAWAHQSLFKFFEKSKYAAFNNNDITISA